MELDATIAVVLACLAAAGGWAATRFGRVGKLEHRLDAIESRERALWLYCRKLIDHIWRGRGAPPPTPPAEVLGMFEDEETA